MNCFRVFLKKYVTINMYMVLIIISMFVLLIYASNINFKKVYVRKKIQYHFDDTINDRDPSDHKDIVNNYYKSREDWKTSNLGSILFKNVLNNFETSQNYGNRTFVILIWKYWSWLRSRHVDNFSSHRNNDPLSTCSVRNCRFTGDDKELNSADAVVVHIQKGVLPNTTRRNPTQRWVFLSDESPTHAFLYPSSSPKISDLANIFNWSMTYRSESDVPVPYGRTIPLQKSVYEQITYKKLNTLVPYWDQKHIDIPATILMSNCAISRRMEYLKELKTYLAVDVYGQCSEDHKQSCPGHFRADCELMSQYLFYLVFENSFCEDYLTEKSFYHAYSKGAIPVIMGPTFSNCKQLLPPNSFLHVDNYESPKELADHIMEISKNDKKLLSYHRWRNDFEVVNEHGYFGSRSYHLCRICEALNYNDAKEKVYDKEALRIYFDSELSCR